MSFPAILNHQSSKNLSKDAPLTVFDQLFLHFFGWISLSKPVQVARSTLNTGPSFRRYCTLCQSNMARSEIPEKWRCLSDNHRTTCFFPLPCLPSGYLLSSLLKVRKAPTILHWIHVLQVCQVTPISYHHFWLKSLPWFIIFTTLNQEGQTPAVVNTQVADFHRCCYIPPNLA